MNGRLFAKRFVGTLSLLLGFACLLAEGETWAKAVAFALFAVLAVLLFRRTAKDDEWMRRYRRGELPGQVLGESFGDSADRRSAKGMSTKGVLVGATLLHVLAAPFLMLRDLLKMQK